MDELEGLKTGRPYWARWTYGTRCPATREESCGGHFRLEHQTEEGEAKRDDENFMFVGAWEYKGEMAEPALHKEALNYEFIHVQQRNYK